MALLTRPRKSATQQTTSKSSLDPDHCIARTHTGFLIWTRSSRTGPLFATKTEFGRFRGSTVLLQVYSNSASPRWSSSRMRGRLNGPLVPVMRYLARRPANCVRLGQSLCDFRLSSASMCSYIPLLHSIQGARERLAEVLYSTVVQLNINY